MKEAVILAGGLGTRLRQIVTDLPKPMAPVAGRPFLAWLLRYLQMQGIRRVILSVGYKHDAITRYFGRRWCELEIDYAVEDTPLGTGGGMAKALGQASESHVLVLNGDTFLRLDYARLQAVLGSQPHSLLSVALRRVPSAERFGCAEISDGVVRRFSAAGGAGPAFINAGVYCVPRDLLNRYPLPARFSFEDEFLAAKLEELQPAACLSDDPFIDIGVPESYADAQILLPQWSCLGQDLLWRDVRVDRPNQPLSALFLDRDGVMIEEKNYLSDPNQVEILDGIPELICEAHRRGMLVVEVTNQAGIGRGKFQWSDFVAVQNRIETELRLRGAELDAIFACPHHKEGVGTYSAAEHPWRKPNPGMLLVAKDLLNTDLASSVLLGDKTCDILAARAAGMQAVLLLTGQGPEHRDSVQPLVSDDVRILPDAAAFLAQWGR
jgi:D-glycero-alpha-D-manno-heptose 1-phosphate guanylyltransferase